MMVDRMSDATSVPLYVSRGTLSGKRWPRHVAAHVGASVEQQMTMPLTSTVSFSCSPLP